MDNGTDRIWDHFVINGAIRHICLHYVPKNESPR